MIRQHSLMDLSLGAAVVLVICALAWSLHVRGPAVPKVLAQSTGCPTGSCTPGATRRVLENNQYFDEDCKGYPTCNWNRQTIDDPDVKNNNNYCCLSNGHTARCLLLFLNQSCAPTALETDAHLFSSTEENNQRACEEQRRTGSCSGAPASSRSSSVSSRRPSPSPASCGNNVLETSIGEECDWGGNNSDTLPNRCRTNCKVPACGDGKADDNFLDPISGITIAEDCDNIAYVIDGVQYPAVSPTQWAWNAHEYCSKDCTVKKPSNSLFFMFPTSTDQPIYLMFPKETEQPIYLVRPVFDWNSIFLPFSSGF